MKRLVVIGSTGSIGENTLRVVDHLENRFEIYGLAARSDVDRLADQIRRYSPRVVALADSSKVDALMRRCREGGSPVPEILSGDSGLRDLASADEADTVVSAAVGAAGLVPTYAAVRAGKTVALANKEAMVLAGELLRGTALASGASIVPVDSEHSAIHQCLHAGSHGEVRRLILTASGGPFRMTPGDAFSTITPEQALRHPVWRMGPRISIDSATLMNKGLEVIEARWLFDTPGSVIEVVVHPQSVVHSMVEFVDGSVIAQLGSADMRQPIQYALTYPERLRSAAPLLDWTDARNLEFFPPDLDRFPCMRLAYEALRAGGTAPAVLNAADEIAVAAFLEQRIGFADIPRVIASTLEAHLPVSVSSIEAVLEADQWARRFAEEVLN